ncbi:hypothetical protein AMATHDRAFT_55272 [Amanita thiersii Skay4041]|uniref:Peptidase M43 pregnancy-associated plasma-A domain-containing protein n=1 Tax=Amanita thiersii Skay4041 TaxID=703135 RepID=A0A2A9NQW4_9AGAR|nr:hypothetical protein AMATHDRAFT_55272 [Amanita thiersii Skay4041]
MLFNIALVLALCPFLLLAAPDRSLDKSQSMSLCGTHASNNDFRIADRITEATEDDASDERNDDEKVNRILKVYFNVVATNGTKDGGWASDSQIKKQMKTLNDDFKGSGLSFKLAGTRRIISPDWFANVGAGTAQETALKKRYRKGGANTLNVYTVGFASQPGLLGYATYPWAYSSNKIHDGVVLNHKSLPDGSLNGYNLGKTLVHETGHWVGLFHTFEGGCSGTGDGVFDTPAEARPAFGCPAKRDTCRSAGKDPIHNYMDYTDDDCVNQFTPGQIRRFRQLIKIYRGIR